MAQVSTDRRRGINSSAAIKVACIAASTGNLTLEAEQTVDGIALVDGDRCFVKDQTDTTENGIYVVHTGDWVRAVDFDGAIDVTEGTITPVSRGTVNADTEWRVTNTGSITIGTTSLTFESRTTTDGDVVSFINSGANAVATTAQAKLRETVSALDYGAVGDGVTDDTAAIQAMFDDYDGVAGTQFIFPTGKTFLISSTIDCSFGEDGTVIAEGAQFECSHNGVAFDINPDATAQIPILVTTDTWTKRHIKWVGGTFYNTNVTKTASVAIQAYHMRDILFENVRVGNLTTDYFYCGWKFAGKDSYRWKNCYTYSCVRSYWQPAAGATYTGTLTGNDLIDATWEDCHNNFIATSEAGIYMENRVLGFHVRGGSFNGEPTVAHIRLADNTTLYSRDINIHATHFEQMIDDVPAVLFTDGGSQGYYNVNISGCGVASGTVGWHGFTLARCRGVKIDSNTFNDGSAGATEECVKIDANCRDVVIGQANQYLNIAAGQEIVLSAASNRQHITLEPSFIRSETPDLLTNYTGDAQSDATATSIDMSTEWADFANYLLPPKGYEVTIQAADSGSAAAGADACEARVYKPSSNSLSGVTIWLSGVNNDQRNAMSGFVGADDNGDISLDVDATGASTLDIWIAITGVHQ